MHETKAKSGNAQRGAINKYLYALLAAAAIGGYVAYAMIRYGLGGFNSFTLFMALAAVIAGAIVAPGNFTPDGNRAPWEKSRSRATRTIKTDEGES